MSPRTWTLLALGALGCAGTETGNPSIDGQLALGAHSSDPALVAVRDPAGGIVVDAAWLSLGPVELLRGPDCAKPQRHESVALGAADHSGPKAAILNLEIQPGVYCGLTLSFTADPSPPSDAASGAPIHIAGRLPDSTAFTITLERDRVITVPARDGGFLLEADDAALLVGFDVAQWLGALSFLSAALETDGSIRIDDSRNPELLAAFEGALATGIEVYRDRDADGALDTTPELVARGTAVK